MKTRTLTDRRRRPPGIQIWNVNRVLESYPAIGILPAAVGVPLLLKRFVVRKRIEIDTIFFVFRED
jgi:hypothetical protein